MGKARFRISFDGLSRALNLPPDAKIVNVDANWHGRPNSIEIYVEAPDLPTYEEGESIPDILPIWQSVEGIRFLAWTEEA